MTAKRNILSLCLAGVCILALNACERPPVDAAQNGFRGTAMVQMSNPRAPQPDNAFPPAPPLADRSGQRSSDAYQNVQVLGDLSVGEFSRLMVAITAWVAPDQGCGYCHNLANLASDEVYTKHVARSMIQMTQDVNANWQQHVGGAGVNCYSCHRGKNVPEYIWFEGHDTTMGAFVGSRNGQNRPAESVGYSSLPADPFTQYVTSTDSGAARVQNAGAFPARGGGASIQETEAVYGLMMHFSGGLGVNCTYCHNTGSFQNWQTSTPQRTTAWHGLQMVRHLNEGYLLPLDGVFPPNRLGPTGDVPKLYCATCHQGQNKPLGGADAVTAYPSLTAR